MKRKEKVKKRKMSILLTNCYICDVYPLDEKDKIVDEHLLSREEVAKKCFQHKIKFLYKRHKNTVRPEQVCDDCYKGVVDGSITEFENSAYGYRGIYVNEDNYFHPADYLDGKLTLLKPDEEGYFCISTGSFSTFNDLRREYVGGPLIVEKPKWW